jgi:hypothetical protein
MELDLSPLSVDTEIHRTTPRKRMAAHYGESAIKQIVLGNVRNAESMARVASHHALDLFAQYRGGKGRRHAIYSWHKRVNPGDCHCELA